jgi:hypothetical protein
MFLRRNLHANVASQTRVESFLCKWNMIQLLACTATLIIDDIQYIRKSCHDEYEFRTVPFTISCCKLHFYHPKSTSITNKIGIFQTQQTPLLYPSLRSISIYHAKSAGSRDQLRPGSVPPQEGRAWKRGCSCPNLKSNLCKRCVQDVIICISPL